MNVLTVGQKIKKIRKEISLPYHKVTQAELAGNGISTSSIGHLEKGDLKINNHLARVIIENASTIAKKNGKEFNYTVEWLMEDREHEVHDLIRTHIIELRSNPTDSEFKKIKFKIDFLCSTEKVESNQLFVIHDCYTKYYEKSDVNLAKASLLKMYEIASKTNNLVQQLYVIKWITYIASLLERWEDIITWGNIAVSLSYKKNIELFMKKIYFNMAIAYKFTNQFQECNKYLELIENNYTLEENEQFDISILKADCYKEMNEYSLANKIFMGLLGKLKSINDPYRYAMIYTNMADLKCKENDLEAIELIQKALNIKMPNELKFKFKETQMLHIALKIYTNFKYDFNETYNTFINLWGIALITKEYNLQFESINILYNYSLISNDIKLMKKLLKKIQELNFNDAKKNILYFKILSQLYRNNDKDFENELLIGFNLTNKAEI